LLRHGGEEQMSIKFKRVGTTTISNDHNFLLNKGVRTHAEIDTYLAEIDRARGGKSELKLRLDAIETKNTDQDTRLTNVETKNTTQDTRLTAIEKVNTDQDTRLTTNENNINNVYFRVGAVETKNTAQDTKLADHDDKFTANDKRFTTIETNATTLKGRVDGHDNQFNSLNKSIGALSDRVTSLENVSASGEIQSAHTDKDGYVFATLKDRLDDMQTKIGTGGGGGTSYDPDAVRLLDIDYKYDDTGVLITETYTDMSVPTNPKVVKQITYTYSKDGEVQKETIVVSSGTYERTYTMTNGLVSKESIRKI